MDNIIARRWEGYILLDWISTLRWFVMADAWAYLPQYPRDKFLYGSAKPTSDMRGITNSSLYDNIFSERNRRNPVLGERELRIPNLNFILTSNDFTSLVVLFWTVFGSQISQESTSSTSAWKSKSKAGLILPVFSHNCNGSASAFSLSVGTFDKSRLSSSPSTLSSRLPKK
jgi:hypothetical protein